MACTREEPRRAWSVYRFGDDPVHQPIHVQSLPCKLGAPFDEAFLNEHAVIQHETSVFCRLPEGIRVGQKHQWFDRCIPCSNPETLSTAP